MLKVGLKYAKEIFGADKKSKTSTNTMYFIVTGTERKSYNRKRDLRYER